MPFVNHKKIDKLKKIFGINSNADLAKKLEIHPSHLSRFNCGKNPIPVYFDLIIEIHDKPKVQAGHCDNGEYTEIEPKEE